MQTTIPKNVTSSYTAVYNVLLQAQEKFGRSLKITEVEECLERTPGLAFAPGTTFGKVLNKLQHWQLVEIDGDFIRVIS